MDGARQVCQLSLTATGTPMPLTPDTALAELERLNTCCETDFVAALGGLFEHSAWVAEKAASLRPFASIQAVHDAMMDCVRNASSTQQIALFKAHPELAGKEASSGTLTEASTGEQGRLGIDRLTGDEFERLTHLNRRYQQKFGFPCIIALRLHGSRQSVLAEFERRLGNAASEEQANTIEQIGFITRGRLATVFRAGGR